MKFAEHLSAHITPEWRKQYISYEEMKAMLYLSVEEAPSTESVEPEELTRHFSNFDEIFILYCDKELKKINTFYSEKLAEATRKFANLRSDLASSLGTRKMKRSASIVERTKPDVPARKMQELKLAFSEFYLSLILLQNYQNLNYMGFKKILKKHDKLLTVNTGSRWMEENVDIAHFHVNKDIGRIIQETESTVIQELEGGDRQKAMKRLRVPPLGEQQSPWTTFKVGLFSGSFIILLIAAVLSAFFHDGGVRNLRTGFRLYRGPLLIIAFLFCISINIYGWRSSGVNHVLIFELDPRNHISEQDLMELSAVMGVIWAISFLSFLFSNDLSMSPYVNPCGLTVVMFFFLFNFSNTFNHDGRMWVIRILGKMVIAPLKHVGFADFWLADQLNSLTPVFTDLHFSVWFYATRNELLSVSDDQDFVPTYWFVVSKAAVSCIPAWIRFAQCLRRYYDSKEPFPHLVNAGKYSTTFFVIIFFTLRITYASDYFSIYDNPFFWVWVISSIVSSVYAYIWDIRMDWGLLDKKAGENKFLREEIVYSSKSYYYFAMINDLILRFMWAIAFALTQNHFVDSELMSSLQASLELFRRFVWNYFRLENEHLNNCGQFRAVRDISIAPIDSSDYTQMIRMMDEDNGVINRNVKRKGVKKQPKEERRLLIPKESTLPELQFIA